MSRTCRQLTIPCPSCRSTVTEAYAEPIPHTDDYADCVRCRTCGHAWALDPAADLGCPSCGGSGTLGGHYPGTPCGCRQWLVPMPSLVLLVGSAGAGKSRVARAFPATWRLELDRFRAAVADDAGCQNATADAVRALHAVLDARLARRLPVVADATHAEERIRAGLLQRARHHHVPAVAVLVTTPLGVCQDRQLSRPPTRQVPVETIAWQHQQIPTAEQLLAEGFDRVHHAAELDPPHLLLQRVAADSSDPLTEVRAVFGEDLAAVFTWHTDPATVSEPTGAFAIAGDELTVRWRNSGADAHFQARTCCEGGCPGPAWAKTATAADLLAVYENRPGGDEVWCDGCNRSDLVLDGGEG
jgi:predicted kinase